MFPFKFIEIRAKINTRTVKHFSIFFFIYVCNGGNVKFAYCTQFSSSILLAWRELRTLLFRICDAVHLLAPEVEVLQGSAERGGPAGHPPLLCRLHCRERQGKLSYIFCTLFHTCKNVLPCMIFYIYKN